MPLLTTLGLSLSPTPLNTPIPNLATPILITNFLFTYIVANARWPKTYYGLDHNESPRLDLDKYGDEAVKAGKIGRRTLDMLKRWEAAHANNLEAFPAFVGTLLFALHSGLPTASVNRFAALYMAVKVAYTISYIKIETEKASFLRTALWMTGNGLIVGTLVESGRLLGSVVPVVLV